MVWLETQLRKRTSAQLNHSAQPNASVQRASSQNSPNSNPFCSKFSSQNFFCRRRRFIRRIFSVKLIYC
ncbi:hypothetical protein HAX54_023836 [Datura stramonium]|uniref:Uncharacterized protein n=1 Tax=Datura stramonium TaxID=4076 RepID=A0ABS8UXB5_DATST|nr:hypothetical protein [Datura stramonium]